MYLLEKVRSCVVLERDSGYCKFNWTVGSAPAPTARNVCRSCFMTAYDCSHGYIESIVSDMKSGTRSYDQKSSDKRARVNLHFISHLEVLAGHYGVKLTRAQMQAITVPNSVESLSAFGWLQNYFSTVGEHQPKIDEIHLDPCTKTHIWEEYKQTMDDAGEVCFTAKFLRFFSMLIPYVYRGLWSIVPSSSSGKSAFPMLRFVNTRRSLESARRALR